MAKKSENYEDMIKRLELIIEELEGNQVDISTSMKIYEEGVKLVNKLYLTLDSMEGKLKVINEGIEEKIKE
ncbi:exodeoxyribonuclease VII small subunit [Clostridium sp. 'White wine YQ']|uniref:exodeoxyribonuclease VII small subunit n=1 Tax=Clostridium sp. 'White wine YQ' TaxID=3027474 RepID=UPI002366CAF8|nr:exodeoxyribonuclease VII small subunit [Clostridium sp. 'White wine YQ']MDD7793934.1 exodeoxyribonuclease VII small subunit [Clostridium sp. 'White wine YQ']